MISLIEQTFQKLLFLQANEAPMTSRLLILFFSTLFLSCSLGEQLQENRRQKRGVAKMMMHMMWDPVRLIRYWHAYDVTKEIAKSWRKIIPTMVLYPYLGHTNGVAKYMNPTHGLTVKSRNKKQTGQFKYPDEHTEYVQSWIDQSMEDYSSPGGSYSHSHTHMDTPVNDYGKTLSSGYVFSNQEQPETSKTPEIRYGERLPGSHVNLESASSMGSMPVIFRPRFKMSQSLGSLGPDAVFAVVNHGHKNAHHVYLKPISHREFKRDNRGRVTLEDQHSGDGQKFVEGVLPLPFPYHVGNERDQPVTFKEVPMPEFDSSVEVDEAASSNIDDTKMRNTHLRKEYLTSRHPGWVRIHQDSKVHSEIPVPLTGHRQEIHIVLHPIPIGDSNQGSAEKSMHFVPYNINANESSVAKDGHFSIIMPSIVPSSHEEKNSSPIESQSKSVDNKSHPGNKTSPSSTEDVYDTKQTSRVMWVLRGKTASDTSAETFAKTSSEDAKDDTNQYPLRLKGQKIDMKQLKQDLKHGTPVLIPFDKKVKFQQNSEDSRNSARNGHMAGTNDPNSIRNSLRLGHEVDISSEAHQELEESRPHYSNEEFEDNKPTQRLLLFLAKKPLPYRR
ncbi:hypothetical protein JTE90_007934 [Oedothorax gibbosus]|uniref:Uncharacterized protein n=1 Tax=Oedothorax gibbosus TaxID=931172 RepID=A0AAV6VJX8_9ARAC|nr:hypothetical protein JTE90_007934 [Oedothorax gibbosus]